MRFELKLRCHGPLVNFVERSHWTWRPSKNDVIDAIRRRQADGTVKVLAYAIDQILTVEQVEL